MIQKPAMLLLQYSCLSEGPNKNTFHYFNTGALERVRKKSSEWDGFTVGLSDRCLGEGLAGVTLQSCFKKQRKKEKLQGDP